jgi:hypothetical protein
MGLFKWREFDETEVTLLNGRLVLRFLVLYRDVKELLGEGSVAVDHVTYGAGVALPEAERRLRKRLKATNDP